MGLVLSGASTQRPPLTHLDDRVISPWEMTSLWYIITHIKQTVLLTPGVPLSLLSHSQLEQWTNRPIGGFLGEGGFHGKQAEDDEHRELASGEHLLDGPQVRIINMFFLQWRGHIFLCNFLCRQSLGTALPRQGPDPFESKQGHLCHTWTSS